MTVPLKQVSSIISSDTVTVGVFPGEGIGPEIVGICERLLLLLEERGCFRLRLRRGGPIGIEGREVSGADLPEDAVALAEEVFAEGGAILAGPGGGRFVYDMRRRFDLFVKLNPLRAHPGAVPASRKFDILVVRDNREGLYQGESVVYDPPDAGRVSHTFHCSARAVDEITDLAARQAAARRGHLTVVGKESGLPEIARIWRSSAEAAGDRHGVEVRFLEIDFAVYQLVREPAAFDVIAAPNCFGDLLSDLGGLLMGSRGATYGWSLSSRGRAVYQTNHGAAHDLKGRDMANPAGQILSTAMLLRGSFGREREARWIEGAVEDAWLAGYRTFDMEEIPGAPRILCGTRDFAAQVERSLIARACEE